MGPLLNDLNNAFNPFAIRRKRQRAKIDQHLASTKIMEALEQLQRTQIPAVRAELLTSLANAQLSMANAARALGRKTQQVNALTITADLYRVLGDVEAVVAGERPRRQWHFERELGPRTNKILDLMATTSDLANRVQMLCDLSNAVAEHCGQKAARVLWTLPSPGYSGWLTLQEKAALEHKA